ncbi:hypothetical protein [Arthrobacter sp. EpRS71]|uniref:hypothetical protein n=1 Tax=Arthrobacter sp. EpRS71 TaxID=1743141 RepID=UPI000749297A|nr:hypothetical protein [Arthrobacter sp. EpRS71]KUM40221.1 hypothetical protein AR689_02125 [Arthrobacter sp. EpRS71]
MILKQISKIAAALAVSAGLALTGLTPANATEPAGPTRAAVVEIPADAKSPAPPEPAGQYYSFCTNLGLSFNWSSNDPATCPGFLDVYIGGQQVAHLNIGGSPGTMLWSCALGVGGAMVTVFAPGGAVVGWALVQVISGIGLTLMGCAGW